VVAKAVFLSESSGLDRHDLSGREFAGAGDHVPRLTIPVATKPVS
jgi:hypothetical protein